MYTPQAAVACYLAAASSKSSSFACAPVLGSKCENSRSGPSKTNAPPCCRPWSFLGGSHGFQRLVASIRSAAPSLRARSRIAKGVSTVKKVVATPFFRPRASYAAFSGSQRRASAGRPTCSQYSRPRSAVPMPTATSLAGGLPPRSTGSTSRASCAPSSWQNIQPNDRISTSTARSSVAHCSVSGTATPSVARSTSMPRRRLNALGGAVADGTVNVAANSESMPVRLL
mmetsp:Transcript_23334/g.68079  ORF Transcript_23334/g.68079 Transcript_23334/m.68079 type:complete len:228 (+) Transcript_23334:188-871(+)